MLKNTKPRPARENRTGPHEDETRDSYSMNIRESQAEKKDLFPIRGNWRPLLPVGDLKYRILRAARASGITHLEWLRRAVERALEDEGF